MENLARARQLDLYESTAGRDLQLSDTTSTFADNLSLPIHRWFKYSAGFSALWVRRLIEREKVKGRRTLLDPFAGSGTTIIEGEGAGLSSIGIEAHPFVARIARAKLKWRSNSSVFLKLANSVLESAMATDPRVELTALPKLLNQCFPVETLRRLLSLRVAWSDLHDGTAASELTWLTLMAILRECSPVGTAQWQYVLPNKSKARALDPFTAFANKAALFGADMEKRQSFAHGPQARIRQEDARNCQSIPDGWADFIVTSPPYANNYDYADATRLEMTFAGEIAGWGDLQHSVRQYLVRSCSHHVAPIRSQTQDILDSPRFARYVLKSPRYGNDSLLRESGTEEKNHITPWLWPISAIWPTCGRACGASQVRVPSSVLSSGTRRHTESTCRLITGLERLQWRQASVRSHSRRRGTATSSGKTGSIACRYSKGVFG